MHSTVSVVHAAAVREKERVYSFSIGTCGVVSALRAVVYAATLHVRAADEEHKEVMSDHVFLGQELRGSGRGSGRRTGIERGSGSGAGVSVCECVHADQRCHTPTIFSCFQKGVRTPHVHLWALI
jgi:hypothetical protein